MEGTSEEDDNGREEREGMAWGGMGSEQEGEGSGEGDAGEGEVDGGIGEGDIGKLLLERLVGEGEEDELGAGDVGSENLGKGRLVKLDEED